MFIMNGVKIRRHALTTWKLVVSLDCTTIGVHILADINVALHDHLLVRLGWNNTPAQRKRLA